MGIVIVALSFGLVLFFHFDLWFRHRRDHVKYKLFNREAAAENAFWEWRWANLDVCVGDVPYAKELVLNYIAAYECCREVYLSLGRNEEHVANWYALLYECADPPPGKFKFLPQSARATRAFSYEPVICRDAVSMVK